MAALPTQQECATTVARKPEELPYLHFCAMYVPKAMMVSPRSAPGCPELYGREIDLNHISTILYLFSQHRREVHKCSKHMLHSIKDNLSIASAERIMLTAIDHIIIGVHDLEEAALVFSQKLGLTVSGGG